MTEVCATNKVCDTRREGKGGNNGRVGKNKKVWVYNEKLGEII